MYVLTRLDAAQSAKRGRATDDSPVPTKKHKGVPEQKYSAMVQSASYALESMSRAPGVSRVINFVVRGW